jgi:two-component system, NtrC family, sensor kinase
MTELAARPAHLLIVEDSETQALAIRRMLEGAGFTVDRADSAEAALDQLSRRLPDLVVADYHLPGMNGGELSRQIRLDTRTRSLPLLMLTNAAERETERDGLESGADAYISKAADHGLMILRIRALLRQRPSAAAMKEGDRSPAPLRRIHVLLLDDPGPARDSVVELLTKDGYRVDALGDATAALERLGDSAPPIDCVLVGLRASGFDGIAACRRINALRDRGMEASADAAAFLIIGMERAEGDGRDLLARAFDAGVDECIPAQPDPGVMRVRIRAVVRRKLLQDDARRSVAEQREHALTEQRARMTVALTQANHDLEQANQKLRDAQAKLVQAAKMASLGELVAGIAHEINNPLAFILAHQGTVERLLGQVEPEAAENVRIARTIAKARDRTQAMGTGLKRIQDIILSLRRFSRMDSGGFQHVDIPAGLDTVLFLLGPKLGERITVSRHYEGPTSLWCSPALLNQVVMNIVSNAADAIEGKGHIDISTKADEEWYEIAVGDSGPGIPGEIRHRVFEPFFTTKAIGSGTGLGLAIAYNVIQSHQGTLAIETSIYGGAAFVIRVPSAPQALVSA